VCVFVCVITCACASVRVSILPCSVIMPMLFSANLCGRGCCGFWACRYYTHAHTHTHIHTRTHTHACTHTHTHTHKHTHTQTHTRTHTHTYARTHMHTHIQTAHTQCIIIFCVLQMCVAGGAVASGLLPPAALGRVRVVASVHPSLNSFLYSQPTVRSLQGVLVCVYLCVYARVCVSGLGGWHIILHVMASVHPSMSSFLYSQPTVRSLQGVCVCVCVCACVGLGCAYVFTRGAFCASHPEQLPVPSARSPICNRCR